MTNDNYQSSIEDLIKNGKDSSGQKLNAKISEIKEKEKEELLKKQAAKLNIPYINLFGFALGAEALKIIPLKTSEELGLICFLLLEGNARFGAINPQDKKVQSLVNNLAKNLRARAEIYMISPHSFAEAIKIYRQLPEITEKIKGIEIKETDFAQFTSNLHNLKDFNKLLSDVPTSNLLTLVIAAAVKMRASDIHIEPTDNGSMIRFRIDGMLHDISSLDKDQTKRIISRVKLLAELKLNVTDRPQDGRYTIYLTTDRVDVRVSALPTNYGETLTMRLLTSSMANLKLTDLGFNEEAFNIIEEEIKKPNGMIISTGPTGSGKTTTLYAIMNKVNNPQTKIITIEDPIEYKMRGISQSQVNPDRDYSFAKGLKSLVRQDPDILMVGEIRDLPTAEIAIQAALTGHLLLTTLHTNQAAGTIARLIALGAKPFLMAPALNVIIGQRLIRTLCEHCKTSLKPTPEQLTKMQHLIDSWPTQSILKKPNLTTLTYYGPNGCDQCQNFGYWGRIGIFEILRVTDVIKDAIIGEKTAEHQLEKIAQEQGMLTLAQDGLLKVASGLTSPEELFRITI